MAERAHVALERRGPVCLLRLRRPEKLNALSAALERDLLATLADERARTAACLVFAGEGKAFSAGADIAEFRDSDPAAIAAYYRETGDVYERIAALPQPTFAAVHGWCLGGGLELALAADFRIADETAAFGLPEVELGILPSSGGTHRLVRFLGPARAKEVMLLNRRFDARRALELGLVTEVVPPGRALERALELASELAELPRLALTVTKQVADAVSEASREGGVLLERLAYGLLAQTGEAQGAVDDFLARPNR